MKGALIKAGYGLYVLSVKDDKKDNACIVNTFLQVTSAAPFDCVVAVSKLNYTHDILLGTRKLNLSVLTVDTPFEIYERFGLSSGRESDKFDGYKGIDRSTNGLYYLTEYTNAYMSLEVIGTEDFGSHTLFRVRLTDGEVLSDAESVTYAYYYRFVKKTPNSNITTGYRCIVCNYVWQGESLPDDFVCPLCKHGADSFVKL